MFLEAPARLAIRGALRRGTAGAGLADRDERPKIDSAEALEAWLKDKPAEWAQAIAVRAALRVFPLVLHVFEVEGEGFTFEQRKGLILRILRPCLIFFPVFRNFREEYVLSEKVEKFSVYGALGVTVNSAYGEEGERSRRSASRAAATAVYSAFKAVSNGQSTSASKCIAATADAARYSAGDAAASSVWQAVSDDFSWLTGHGTGSDLINQPLWLSDVRGKASYRANFPPWVREPFDRFAARDEVKNGPWQLIIDWYRAILPNSRNAKPRSIFSVEGDEAIATRPDEFWTITKERCAEDILEEIAQIGGYEPLHPLAGSSSLVAVEILQFLEHIRLPATFDDIHAAVTSSHPDRTISLVRRRLGALEQFSRVVRTSEGLYVHPDWATDTTPDWDFFLSYSQHDLAAARRISDVLEDEGYAVFSQFNDMTAGKSFVGEMNRGLAGMGRMIAAYSPDYFSSGPCQSEWEAAYTADPSGKKGKTVPFMVRPCEPLPLASRLVWTSLLGLSPEQEREAVLRAVRGGLAPRDRVAQRAAMKAAASPDVGLDPSGQKLDALPNAKFDQPFVDEDLFELPERLRSLIGTILDVLEGRNAPRGLATALRGYASELEARGANCSLGVLRDQMAFVEAEVDDPEAEYWCSGAGLKTSIATLRRHHALLLTHYPLDQERERLLRAVEIDEEKFSPDESRKLRDEIKEAVKEALADDSVTESYRDAVENRARVVRDTLDLRTPDVPTDGDPEYIRREQDRSNRVKDAKKRALAQEAALADKTLDVIGRMAKIADSPAVQKLARSMRDLAEWFWSS